MCKFKFRLSCWRVYIPVNCSIPFQKKKGKYINERSVIDVHSLSFLVSKSISEVFGCWVLATGKNYRALYSK